VGVVKLYNLWFAAVQQIIADNLRETLASETTIIISQATQQHKISEDNNLQT
jgi:hypothetical protein